jgi:hypothetical protein
MPDLHHRHPAFVLACVFGAFGVVLLIAAAAFDSDALYFATMGAGVLSLGSALYWRSLLVSNWAERKPRSR